MHILSYQDCLTIFSMSLAIVARDQLLPILIKTF